MSIKAIIFDMDGVLIDAKDWHYDALNRALGLFGMDISRYDHLVTYDGLPTRKKLEMLSRERGLPHPLHDFIHEMKQLYTMQLVHALCKPVFQHEYALSKLKKEGYLIGLASNSIRDTVKVMMEKANLSQYLDISLSNEDVNQPKPNPEIYLKAIQLLNLTPSECVILEDNENGLRAAKESGAHVLRVHKVQEVTHSGIHAFISHVEQTLC
jgi:HAD superfamily hydrolase (TIGR01509 family)